jgi:RNA polymerase sigma-70 factor (ECF subfamily)
MLVVLAQSGDDSAFGELVRRRAGFMRQLLRHLCRDPSVADDISQQVFIQAWRSLPQLRSAEAFPGWLRRLAVNSWLQHLRRRGGNLLPLAAIPEEQATPTMLPEQLDLDSALARLAPEVRLCVVLSYHEGLSHGEISRLVSMPLGTVKSHVARGAAQLRQYLKEYR